MPTYTVYATRTSSATVRSRDTASYANARDGVNTGGASSITGTGGIPMYAGQSDASDVGSYITYDYTGLIFDTSAVSGTITSAVLEIYAVSTQGTPDWDIEARVHDFSGAVTYPTDFVDADDLAAKTLVATLTKSAITTSAYNTFTDVALAANIVAGGSTELILASSRSRSATAPTVGTTERVNFTSPLSPLGANGPRLVITTAAVPEGSLSKTLDASTLSADGALAIAGEAGITLDAATLSSDANIIGVGEGSVNKALDAATLSATIGIETFGYSTVTLGAATLSADASLAIVGTSTATLSDATLLSAGAADNTGTLTVTLGDATIASSTAAGITGDFAVTLDGVSLSALQSGPAWPVVYGFPQAPLDGTWRRNPADDTLRSERKVGARSYRGRDGGNYADVEFAVHLNGTAQIGEMDRFYRDDCGNGSRPFYWPHPETGTIVAWTWATPPALRHVAGRIMRAEIQLRMEAA